jgi:NTP pyrophosphatase (non-canonical NTP hydrolase)
MNHQQREILLIAQEECAEVTQAISKIFRFGIDSDYLDRTNKQRLEDEVGDLLCMIDLMKEFKLINTEQIELAKIKKLEKLKQWSSIHSKIN